MQLQCLPASLACTIFGFPSYCTVNVSECILETTPTHMLKSRKSSFIRGSRLWLAGKAPKDFGRKLGMIECGTLMDSQPDYLVCLTDITVKDSLAARILEVVFFHLHWVSLGWMHAESPDTITWKIFGIDARSAPWRERPSPRWNLDRTHRSD